MSPFGDVAAAAWVDYCEAKALFHLLRMYTTTAGRAPAGHPELDTSQRLRLAF